MLKSKNVKLTVFLGLFLLATILSISRSQQATAGLGFNEPKWTSQLPADLCYGTNHTMCHLGSPVVTDIDNDLIPDIVAVTNNGHVVAISSHGSLLWDTDIAPFFDMAPGTHEILSSPAAADIDNDGFVEIAVGAGTTTHDICTRGGLIVLDHLGRVEDGWPFVSLGDTIVPLGCADTIISSPAMGDLDKDGDLEIVAAGFDKRIYAWHHDGQLVNGFPPDSAHRERFPVWEDLIRRLGDNTWSSPALADLDRDGYLDIIIGTGEGNYEARWGGDANGWTCPYELPEGWPPGYCGGSIYALDRFGNSLPGFPRYVLEAIGSSPAVSDVNDDGKFEIFIGTGNFYFLESPDHPTVGFRLYGLDSHGNDLPGWEGGKITGGTVMQSPSIGDIAGDNNPEIVVLAADNKLYAWHINGVSVSGFPMAPLDYNGDANAPFDWIRGQLLADYDGDGKMEIVFAQGWSITVVDGDGHQLTGSNYPNNSLPIYYAAGLVMNTPGMDDIDNDGVPELIVTNNKMTVWELPTAANGSDWATFKGSASRTSVYPQPRLHVEPANINLMHQSGDSGDVKRGLTILNAGNGSFEWTASFPEGVTITPASGSVSDNRSAAVTLTIPTSNLEDGRHYIGKIVFRATLDDGVVKETQSVHEVWLTIGDISHMFAPLVQK